MKNRAILKLHYKCNNNCIFCHSHPRNSISENIEKHLMKIDRALEIGIDQLLFSGGEPTIYRGLKKILEYIEKKSIIPGFITNGRMFSYEEFTKYVLRHGSNYFYISLHSHDKLIHDRITGCKNSWEQTCQGIKNLLKFSDNIELMVNCVITKLNINHLNEYTLFLSKIGVKKIKFSFPEMKGSTIDNVNQMEMDYNHAGEMISSATSYAEKMGLECYHDGLPFCFINEHNRMKVNNLEKSDIYFMSEVYEDTFFRTDESNRFKVQECVFCSYDDVCTGFYQGYDNVLLNRINTRVPNFFNLSLAAEYKSIKNNCIMNLDPQNRGLPFNSIIFNYNNSFKQFIFQDEYFKIKNFENSLKKCQIYFLNPEVKHTNNYNFSIKDLNQLKLKQKCDKCLEDCPGIYSLDSDSFFSNISALTEMIKNLKGNILDIGFGEIIFSDQLFNNQKIKYVGIEPDKELYSIAAKKFQEEELHNSTIEDFTYKKNFFDFILLQGSFNHINDIRKGLDVIKGLLKDDGKLIIIENEFFGILWDKNIMPDLEKQYEHYRNSSIENAEIILTNSGYSLKKIDVNNEIKNFWVIVCNK